MFKPQLPPFKDYKKEVFGKAIVTGQFIHQIGESDNLRKPSKEVPIRLIKTKEFKEKLQYVKECLLEFRELTGSGRGITAVQVGIPEAFSVIYMPELEDELLTIINPEVISQSAELLVYPEMCMSAQPLLANVVRPSWIEFEYLDEDGKEQIWTSKADSKEGKMYNRVFAHEIDHIRGIINIDLVSPNTLIFESDPKFYDKATFEKAK